MKRRKFLGSALFGLMALSVTMSMGCFYGGGGSSATVVRAPTGSGAGTVTIENGSNESIYYIRMSPTSQSNWGPDLLGNQVLHRGQSFTLSNVSPGTWDLRVVDRSGNHKEWRNFMVGAGGVYSLQVTSGGWTR